MVTTLKEKNVLEEEGKEGKREDVGGAAKVTSTARKLLGARITG